MNIDRDSKNIKIFWKHEVERKKTKEAIGVNLSRCLLIIVSSSYGQRVAPHGRPIH